MHNKEDWKVKILDMENGYMDSQIFIYQMTGRIVAYLQIEENKLVVKTQEYKAGESDQIKSFMTCDRVLAMGIAKGFLAYANEQGFKNGDETFVKGKLEATERHLEDMRKIVFEPVITGTEIKRK